MIQFTPCILSHDHLYVSVLNFIIFSLRLIIASCILWLVSSELFSLSGFCFLEDWFMSFEKRHLYLREAAFV